MPLTNPEEERQRKLKGQLPSPINPVLQ